MIHPDVIPYVHAAAQLAAGDVATAVGRYITPHQVGALRDLPPFPNDTATATIWVDEFIGIIERITNRANQRWPRRVGPIDPDNLPDWWGADATLAALEELRQVAVGALRTQHFADDMRPLVESMGLNLVLACQYLQRVGSVGLFATFIADGMDPASAMKVTAAIES